MKQVKLGKTVEVGKTMGREVVAVPTGKVLGVYTGSVGPYGTSTGIFSTCKTTCSFAELRLRVVSPYRFRS
jgi:hypothetical protein